MTQDRTRKGRHREGKERRKGKIVYQEGIEITQGQLDKIDHQYNHERSRH
jgi:hypothetical protein